MNNSGRKKTKAEFLKKLYNNMKDRVLGRVKHKAHLYFGKEIIDRAEFYDWAEKDTAFHSLFEDYEAAGYQRRLAPSVDRLESNIGYIIGNMEFVTQSENSIRANISRSRK